MLNVSESEKLFAMHGVELPEIYLSVYYLKDLAFPVLCRRESIETVVTVCGVEYTAGNVQ